MRSCVRQTPCKAPLQNHTKLYGLHRAPCITVLAALNRPFSEWNQVFPNATCVVALIDRLVHRSEILSIDGESYRLKEAKERAAKRAAARSTAKKPRAASR